MTTRSVPFALILVAGCAGGGGGGGSSASAAPGTPPGADPSVARTTLPGTQPLVVDTGVHAVPSGERPPLHVPVTDPVFGTTITRITDPSLAPGGALGIRHEYSRYAVVNADGTKVSALVLGGDDTGQVQVRDVASGSVIRTIPKDYFDTEASWHPTDPDVLAYRFGNEFRKFHAGSGQVETVMAFPEYDSVRTKGEGRPADDWNTWAFLGFKDGQPAQVVVADLAGKNVLARWTPPSEPDWVSASPSGSFVVCQFVDSMGTAVYDRNLGYLRQLLPSASHSDFAIDANGDEVLVYFACEDADVAMFGGRAGLAAVRLKDGARTFLFENHWWWGMHLSGIVSRQHRGWVLVSSYNGVGDPQQPLGREVFLLALDGSGEVRRLAHHHSDQARDGDNKDYWAEPQATASWDGSKIVFASVWGEPWNHYDLYMITGRWFEE